MKRGKFRSTLLTAFLIASMLLGGCGSEGKDSDNTEDKSTATGSDAVTSDTDLLTVEDDTISTGVTTTEETTEHQKTVEGIKVTPNKLELEVGESTEVEVKFIPETEKPELVWKSEDTKIVSVSATGKIKGVAKGECVVSVSVKETPSIEEKIRVTVTEKVADNSDNPTAHKTTEEQNSNSNNSNNNSNNSNNNSNNSNSNNGNNNNSNNSNSSNNSNNNNNNNNNNSNSNNNNTATTQPATEAATTEEATPPSNSGYYNYAYCEQVLLLVNEHRAANGLGPLAMDYTIQAASDVRAKEIVDTWSHDRPNGSSCFTALDEAGVSYWTAGENIAYGQPSPESVFNAWKNSSGHNANMLGSGFGKIGISCYVAPNGCCYWVQLFTD